MIKEVHFEKTTYNELPFKFEAGTPDFIGVIGLGEAIRYVESLGLPEIAVYEQQLLDYAMERMRQVPAMRIFGEAIRKSSVLSFALGEIHHSDTGILLDKMGIAVRTGQLCAEPVMQHYGVTGMVGLRSVCTIPLKKSICFAKDYTGWLKCLSWPDIYIFL